MPSDAPLSLSVCTRCWLTHEDALASTVPIPLILIEDERDPITYVVPHKRECAVNERSAAPGEVLSYWWLDVTRNRMWRRTWRESDGRVHRGGWLDKLPSHSP